MTPADYLRIAWRILAPPPGGTIWDWLCRHGRIPASESGRPGPWMPGQATLFRKPLSIAWARLTLSALPTDPHARHAAAILVCAPSQVGKTKSFLHGVLAYAIDVMRTNVAFITHKQKQIKQHLRIRLLPMFESTPRLQRYLPTTEALRRERLGGSLWQLEGANLHAICGNVASDLREYSHQIGISDEIEAYTDDVDGEGDPITLFLDRQKRYEDTSLFAAASTPNRVDGHTWSKLCQGTHERLLIRCLACGQDQDLSPDHLVALDTALTPDEIHRRDAAAYACPACGVLHRTDAKDRMVAEAIAADRWVPGTWQIDDAHPSGHWTPATAWRLTANGKQEVVDLGTWTAKGDNPRWQLASWTAPLNAWRTFQFNYLHHPECACGRFLAHELKAALGRAEEYHGHVTGWRAEPYLTAGTALTTDAVTAAIGAPYRLGVGPVTPRWLIVTADQQGNSVSTCWFAFEVRAVAPGGESWLVDTGTVHGMAGLRELEQRTYLCGGVSTRIARIAVDGSNGNVWRALRAWAAESYQALRVAGASPDAAKAGVRRILLEGDASLAADTPWRERVPGKRDLAHIPEGCRIFRWNKTWWKDHAAARLAGQDGHPPLHLPTDDPEMPKALKVYLSSLTSEERVVARIGAPGGRKRDAIVWQERLVKDPTGREHQRTDTHWWDACVMADVLSDLIGAFRVEAAGPDSGPTPDPVTPTTRPAPPPPTPGRPRLTRRFSRLARRKV